MFHVSTSLKVQEQIRRLETYPPLKQNRPGPKRNFISEPPIFRGELLVAGRVSKTHVTPSTEVVQMDQPNDLKIDLPQVRCLSCAPFPTPPSFGMLGPSEGGTSFIAVQIEHRKKNKTV